MSEFQLVNPENPDKCDPSKSQWYLDCCLAERIANWATRVWANDRLHVLEPSAGRGALVSPLVAAGHRVTAIDIDPDNADWVASKWTRAEGVEVISADFTAFEDWPGVDLALLNPPFEKGQTEAHVLHALKFAPRVVCHCPLTTLEGKDRREGLWSTAYLKRLVIHSSRPKYSGSRTGGQTAMCTIDVVRRPEGKPHNGRVAACGVEVEWWA
jgi:hypothetical protein